MFSDILILAGGIGERLWPASVPASPKQFMSLQDGISFFQHAILRALALKPDGLIIVVTRSSLLEAAAQHAAALLQTLSADDAKKLADDLYIIAEPAAKHTAPPVALCCSFAKKIKPHLPHSFLVLTSDHIITPETQFVADVKTAAAAAEKGYFVCFGIPPTEPATGFGYIRHSKEPVFPENSDIYTIEHFKEKPDLETAKSYLAGGMYWWNSGMFGFTSGLFCSELKKYEPAVYQAFAPLDESEEMPVCSQLNGIKYVSSWDAMTAAYEVTPSQSIDLAIAERTDKALTVKTHFEWDDVGSWDAFQKLFQNNACDKAVEIDGSGNFIYSDIPVALCGVSDLIVVVKNGKLLVLKKGASALVRDAVTKMKSLPE